MSKIIQVPVPENNTERLDKLLVGKEGMTRSFVQRLIQDGLVEVDGVPAGKSLVPKGHSLVRIAVPDPQPVEIRPQPLPLEIVYEDADLLVVNKPKGMVVHPAPGNEDGTLVNALLFHCGDSLSGINGAIRPGIVHRIDKDTSGLLIVAKNDFAHNGLACQIKEHSFTRIYEAVVYGNIKEDSFTVNAPIGRHPVDRKRMAVTEKNSRTAITHGQVLKRYRGFTHLSLKLETGRTHQIRVHMAYLGHPVAGDPVYGPKKIISQLHGQCLHARVIGFLHPRTGNYMEFESPLPDYFRNFLCELKEE